MEDIKKLLGKRIREIRKSKNLTQEQLAERVGIGTPNISYFETGRFTPALETMQKIATALNSEIYEFYMFQPLVSAEKLKKELIESIDSDENLLRKLYKFYVSIK